MYGADAENLAALRADLLERSGPIAEARLADGGGLAPAEVVGFTLERLGRLVGSPL